MRRISVDRLERGMVIVRCDRTGIHFPFYGQPIQHHGVIKVLRSHGVRYVYIRTRKTPDPVVTLTEQELLVPDTPNHDFDGFDLSLSDDDSAATIDDIVNAAKDTDTNEYAVTVEEIRKARTIYDRAHNITTELLIDARMGKTVDTAPAKDAVQDLVRQCLTKPNVFNTLTRLKTFDDYTFTHSINVGVLCIALGRRLGMDAGELEQIGLGGMLHDIGKMFVPPAILNKPAKLTDEEFLFIKTHPAMGRDILKDGADVSSIVLDCVGEHHERSDGTGYPLGLDDRSISKFGRITSIADVYDAITSTRCYREGMIPPEAMKLIFSWGGKHFNEVLVKFFSDVLGIYPAGTLVLLDSGEMGIVFDATDDPTRPRVLIVTDRAAAPTAPFITDLTHYNLVSKKPYRSILSPLDPKHYNINTTAVLDNFLASV